MKIRLAIVAVLIGVHVFAAPRILIAQNVQTVADAKRDVEAAGIAVNDPCGAVKIVNLVAWRLRWGLLRKEGGHRASLRPDGSCTWGDSNREPGFATDYVIDPSTFGGYDILSDAGGANGPQWPAQPEMDFVTRNRDNFTAAIDPATYLRGGGGPSAPPTPPGSSGGGAPPVPVTSCDLSPLYARLDALESHLDAKVQSAQEQGTHEHEAQTAQIGEFRKAIGDWWKKALEWGLPALAGILGGREIGK